MMTKLFTPLNVGRMELAHRVIFECTLSASTCLGGAYRGRECLDRMPAGTLMVVSPDATDGVSAESRCWPLQSADAVQSWRRAIDMLHDAGRIVLARLDGVCSSNPAAPDQDAAMNNYRFAARRAREVGFDGIELDGSGALAQCAA